MGYGLKSFQAKQLFDKYKEPVINKIRENPYFLASQVKGYSFLKCDAIAKTVGFSPDSPLRIAESIIYALESAQYEGHTYLRKDVLLKTVGELISVKMSIPEMKKAYKDNTGKDSFVYKYGNLSFKVGMDNLRDCIVDYNMAKSKFDKENCKLKVVLLGEKEILPELQPLKLSNRIIIENDNIYLRDMYDSEEQVAYRISQIIKSELPIEGFNAEELLGEYLTENKIILEANQRDAVLNAVNTMGGFMIIDGSAGCGKTFCLKIALDLIKKMYASSNSYFESIIMAPTGKAALVAKKATDMEASTIHRALKYNPTTGYYYNALNCLPYDCIVLDESSMLDIEVAKHFFNAISPKTKIIFLGDTKQLPSVGAGNVLKDLILSGKLKISTLTVIKRQGLDSGIIKNANRIIAGEMITSEIESKDAYVYKAIDVDACNVKILSLIVKLLNKYTIEDIQVLCPQKNGTIGTNYLNYLIQEKFNPENNEIRFMNKQVSVTIVGDTVASKFDLFFKKGDKVIHTKNNYTTLWYKILNRKLVVNPESVGINNGETGKIVKLLESKDKLGNLVKKIIVQYDDKLIVYENDFSEIDHAYALTIHKSQGSAWKAVILPIMFSNYRMLDRNLFYTGYTRAREFAGVIGEADAIKYAVKTQKSTKRWTSLNEALNRAI